MFKISGAKNRRKNLHKHPGPTFQIRPGPGYFRKMTNEKSEQFHILGRFKLIFHPNYNEYLIESTVTVVCTFALRAVANFYFQKPQLSKACHHFYVRCASNVAEPSSNKCNIVRPFAEKVRAKGLKMSKYNIDN